MDSNQRKAKIIDATMRIVAKKGLESFAVLQAAKQAKVNEALVYRDFGTKENLLYECYMLVHREVAALYDDEAPVDLSDPAAAYVRLHDLWLKFFRLLVNGGYRTIFYQEYRDSEHMKTFMKHHEEVTNTYFKGFVNVAVPIIREDGLPEGMTFDHIWAYLMDTSAMFAKRMIRKDLPNDDASIEAVWALIVGGLRGILKVQ